MVQKDADRRCGSGAGRAPYYLCIRRNLENSRSSAILGFLLVEKVVWWKTLDALMISCFAAAMYVQFSELLGRKMFTGSSDFLVPCLVRHLIRMWIELEHVSGNGSFLYICQPF